MISTIFSFLLFCASLAFFFVISVMAFLLFLQVRNWMRYRSSGCNIPCLPEIPFLGSFRFEQFHLSQGKHRQVGPVTCSSVFHHLKIVCAEPEVAQIALSKSLFPKTNIYDNVRDFWGENLFTLSHYEKGEKGEITGGRWRHERALMNPAFKILALRDLHPLFESLSENSARHLLQLAERGEKGERVESLDFPFTASKITLAGISLAGFGYELNPFEASFNNSFIQALHSLFHLTGSPLLLLPKGGRLSRFRGASYIKVLEETIYKVVDTRVEKKRQQQEEQEAKKKQEEKERERERLFPGAKTSKEQEEEEEEGEEEELSKKKKKGKRDLLDMMLESEIEGNTLSREAIRNELLAIYIAGHETSATMLSWVIYLLSRDPEIKGKVLDEIQEVMGKAKINQDGELEVRAPTMEEVEKLSYLEMVIMEAFRLYTPAIFLPRRIPETFEHNGYIYPEGFILEIAVLSMHRDERFWPEPLKFDPERFAKGNSLDRHPFAYLPFSGGPRICIGRNFFFQEAKTVLATLLRVLDFELDTSKEGNGEMFTDNVVMKPKHVWVFPKKRVVS